MEGVAKIAPGAVEPFADVGEAGDFVDEIGGVAEDAETDCVEKIAVHHFQD